MDAKTTKQAKKKKTLILLMTTLYDQKSAVLSDNSYFDKWFHTTFLPSSYSLLGCEPGLEKHRIVTLFINVHHWGFYFRARLLGRMSQYWYNFWKLKCWQAKCDWGAWTLMISCKMNQRAPTTFSLGGTCIVKWS